MSWHPLVIRFALNIKYLSGTAYQAIQIRQSGMIASFQSAHYLITPIGQHHTVVYSWNSLNDSSPCFRNKCPVDSTSVLSPWMRWSSNKDLSSTNTLELSLALLILIVLWYGAGCQWRCMDQDESSAGQLAEQVSGICIPGKNCLQTIIVHYFSASLTYQWQAKPNWHFYSIMCQQQQQ